MEPLRITLADGSQALLRAIAPDDKPLLEEGLAALSAHSAYQRFLTPMHHFTAEQLRYLTEVDGDAHIALVAVRAAGPRPLLGVARAVCAPGDRQLAEVAIVVRDDVQRLGLGRAMLRALCSEALAHGVRRVTATALASNVAVQRLLAAVLVAVRVRHAAAGVVELSGELSSAGG